MECIVLKNEDGCTHRIKDQEKLIFFTKTNDVQI